MINLTIPVRNEENTLEDKVKSVDAFLSKKKYNNEVFIVISDNNSNDNTKHAAIKLATSNKIPTIYHFTPTTGKGNAIRESWQKYSADKYWFIDLDLSTDLEHLDEIYEKLATNDIVIGSRLLPESIVKRCLRREITSRGYNFILQQVFNKKFSDAQCGFKGVNDGVVKKLIPLIRNRGYFFDTELLLIAEANRIPIDEIPVRWTEDQRSHIKLHRAIPQFLKNMYDYYQRLEKDPESILIH